MHVRMHGGGGHTHARMRVREGCMRMPEEGTGVWVGPAHLHFTFFATLDLDLCVYLHEIKHRVTEMHKQGWAYKMCHFCNPVLALKKY